MRRKRVFTRDWDDAYLKKYYEAPFPFDIPGYKFDRAHSKMAVTQATPLQSKGSYGFTFDIAGLPDFLLENVTLWNDMDFDIPDGGTGEEMKKAMEAITPQDIADALLTHGYEPVAE